MTAIAYDATSTGLRLDLVIRTSKRKKEAKSPQQQRDMASSCADAYGHRIVHVHDSGTDESGKTMNRASINAAMARVRNGETDGVIVALADRIGRAPIEEAMTTVRAFCTEGKLVLADMGGAPLDLANGVNETNVVMQLQFARQYWVATANRFKRSQADAIKAGKFIGPTPLGYARRGGFLFPHETLGPVITEAYRLAAEPEGMHRAAAYLQREVPEREWTTDHVRRVLSSRSYLGESRSGELANKYAHEPLTTLAIWTAAQTKPRHRRTPGDYVLSHVATCGVCGSGLVGALQTTPGGKSYRRYRCSNKACGGGCSIRAETIEGYVRGAVDTELPALALRDNGTPDVANAQALLRRAEMARDTFADDVEYQADLGRDAARRTAAAHQAKVDRAQADFNAAAAADASDETVPLTVDTDQRLLRAIRVGVRSIVVAKGRGSVEDRVVIDFDYGDDVAGALTA